MRYTPITRNNDFQRAYMRGKSYVHPLLVLYVNKNRVRHTRLGITTTKKIGNAVVRNRCRRIIKAALAQVLPKEVGGIDIVLVSRGATAHCKSTQLVPVLRQLLAQAGILP